MIQKNELELEQQLIDFRRHFHQFPELSLEEFETTDYIKKQLTANGVELIDLPLETGVLALIRGNAAGPVIALRSDIDALPIQEATGLSYASKRPGKMHACGHDFHMASILGAALLLRQRRQELAGTVKIIFQPSEENGKGALRVIKTGAMNDVQAIFGMHDRPDLPTGTIGIKNGALMASVDKFQIEVSGVGTHAAAPEKGIDPLVTAAQMVGTLQTIVSRNLPPLSGAIISVTHLEAGNTWNVLPGSAFMEGTVRTFSESDRKTIAEKMKQIVTETAQALGAKASLEYTKIGPVLQNDQQLTNWARETAIRSGLNVVDPAPSFIGEDFANYLQRIPGAFFFVGVSGTADLHQPNLTIDEKAILPSAEFFANLAVDMLNRLDNN